MLEVATWPGRPPLLVLQLGMSEEVVIKILHVFANSFGARRCGG